MSSTNRDKSTIRSVADVAQLGTILGVWAHPDDEAYLSAGLMAVARHVGSRVACVTATRGELGTPDPGEWPPERLASARTRELGACLDLLGVTEHHWLDYPDGGCVDVPEDEAAERLAALMAEIRPDTVLTFGPDGITGHADHVRVGEWTSAARAITVPEARLLHATVTESWLNTWQGLHAEFGVYEPGYPKPTPDADVAIELRCEDGLARRKVDALAAMETQTADLIKVVGLERYTDWVRTEFYVNRSV